MKTITMFFLTCGFLCSCTMQSQNGNEGLILENAGFELLDGTASHWKDVEGWNGNSGEIRNNGFYSPPEGSSYAYQKGEGSWIIQEPGQKIQAGKTYNLKLWARSVNEPGNKTQ